MSIDSLQSNPWANPWAASTSSKAAGTDQSQATFSTSGSNSPWSAQGAAGSSTSSSPANPLQSLAADIQAMLIQAQNTGTQGSATGGTTGATTAEQSAATDLQTMLGNMQAAFAANSQMANTNSTASTDGTTTGATPQHSVATDLQTMLDDLQAAITGNTQTANSDPTSSTGETRHHHHHNIGGGEANGASDVASASTSPDPGASATGSRLAGDQAVSPSLATEIAQAIQAYAIGGASTATAALTV